MSAPASSARALHDILQAVNENLGSSGNKVSRAWQKVSGAQMGGSQFAAFHSEAISLLNDIEAGIATLEQASQAKYRTYLPKWWNSLVQPDANWKGHEGRIISPGDLDMLWSLGDVLMGRVGQRNPHAVEALTQAVTFLLGQVREATDIPPTVKKRVEADLEHVLWLLEHVDVFGVDHAVAAAEQATGNIGVEAAKTRSPSLKKILVGITAALAFISTNMDQVASIAEDTRSVFGLHEGTDTDAPEGSVEATVDEIMSLIEPQALTTGPGADGDAIEGEVVEDEAVGR